MIFTFRKPRIQLKKPRPMNERMIKLGGMIWLMIGIALLIVAMYEMYRSGVEENLELLLFPMIAFAYWGFRRSMLKRFEKRRKREQES